MSELLKKSQPDAHAAVFQGRPLDLKALAHRYSRWVLIIGEFGAVQAIVQVLLAVAGLLIVRTLSKQEYALFAIANSMQTTCNLLADVGIGVGVQSIGGRVWNDRYRFGQLLNTALGMRRTFAMISFVLCLPVAAWMLWRNSAGPLEIAGLCIAIAAGVIPLLSSSVWHVSQLLHGEYRRIQKVESGNAALRLALIGMLVIEQLNALLAVLVGVLGNWIQAFVLRSWARDHADPTAPVNAEDRRELVRISLKSLPNAIFFCFQGQVTLLILTLVGSPTGIADFTALGRVVTLFTVFSAAFASVLAPRFARCQEATRLPRLYLVLVGGTVLVLLPLVAFGWFLPGPFLWLLGSKYAGLESQFGWVVTTGFVGQLGGVMWSLNSSKAWINFQAYAYIPMVLLSQALGVLIFDLRRFDEVLKFGLWTSAAPLLIFIIDALRGIRFELKIAPAVAKRG